MYILCNHFLLFNNIFISVCQFLSLAVIKSLYHLSIYPSVQPSMRPSVRLPTLCWFSLCCHSMVQSWSGRTENQKRTKLKSDCSLWSCSSAFLQVNSSPVKFTTAYLCLQRCTDHIHANLLHQHWGVYLQRELLNSHRQTALSDWLPDASIPIWFVPEKQFLQ